MNLICIATEFRNAFEKADLSNAPGFLSGFPNGCCGWGVRIIGHYLKYECGLQPLHMCGSRDCDGFEEHEWIQVNNYVIDITADQYPESQPKVIVSDSSEWHMQWKETKAGDIVEIATFDIVSSAGEKKASEIYEVLADHVRKKCSI